jgi:hypothetical protein
MSAAITRSVQLRYNGEREKDGLWGLNNQMKHTLCRRGELERLWSDEGLTNIAEQPLEIPMHVGVVPL